MPFDEALYREEMDTLLHGFVTAWRDGTIRPPIYTLSIWTDPAAATSAVSVDTRENSDRWVASRLAFAHQQRERLLKTGNTALADTFNWTLPRNDNPADFAFPSVLEASHASFDAQWASTPGCWHVLQPLMIAVRDKAAIHASSLRLAPEAEVGINSQDAWYTMAVRP